MSVLNTAQMRTALWKIKRFQPNSTESKKHKCWRRFSSCLKGTRKIIIGTNKYEKWSIGLIGKTIDFYYLLKNNSIAEILSQIMNERYVGMINNYSATFHSVHHTRVGYEKQKKISHVEISVSFVTLCT